MLVDGEEFFGDDPTMATQKYLQRQLIRCRFLKQTEQQQLTWMSTGNEVENGQYQTKGRCQERVTLKQNGTDFTKYMDARPYTSLWGKRSFQFMEQKRM